MVCLEIVDSIVHVGLTLLFNQDFQSRINDSLDPPIRTYQGHMKAKHSGGIFQLFPYKKTSKN